MAYKTGDLRVVVCLHGLDEDGCCLAYECDIPSDARGGYERKPRVVSLPHSCDSWVIGGPEEVRLLIQDLEAALGKLKLEAP